MDQRPFGFPKPEGSQKEVVSVDDVVEVRVIRVDLERGRIGLSMKK